MNTATQRRARWTMEKQRRAGTATHNERQRLTFSSRHEIYQMRLVDIKYKNTYSSTLVVLLLGTSAR